MADMTIMELEAWMAQNDKNIEVYRKMQAEAETEEEKARLEEGIAYNLYEKDMCRAFIARKNGTIA